MPPKGSRRTHCFKGHLLSPGNIILSRQRLSEEKRTCRECVRIWQAAEFKSRKDRGQCRSCPEPVATGNVLYCETHRQKRRGEQLKNKYGISPAQYQYMLDQQGGVCAICKQPPESDSLNLDLDHNHRTDVIRGLLHSSCNRALGLLKDNPDIILAASYYVRSSGVMDVK